MALIIGLLSSQGMEETATNRLRVFGLCFLIWLARIVIKSYFGSVRRGLPLLKRTDFRMK